MNATAPGTRRSANRRTLLAFLALTGAGALAEPPRAAAATTATDITDTAVTTVAGLGTPEGAVRQVVFPAVSGGEATPRELVHEFKARGPVYRRTVQTTLKAETDAAGHPDEEPPS
ncbi:hypothetical protein ACFV2H_18165 [Streptomyces sp. NPDC059629]|uniref:hypothetical protein n=1 Tax=Streptomyces sp. NPDC059629 TaxID=3346889 RepID=UPI0036761D55